MGLPKDMNGSSETFFPVSWIESFKLWLPEHADEIAVSTRDALFMPIYQSFPDAPRCSAGQVRSALKGFFMTNDWARVELTAYGGSEILAEMFS